MAHYRKYFVELSNGTTIEIDELDFNNIQQRIATGRTNGWYSQRGEAMGKQHQWSFQFKWLSNLWADKDEKKDVPIRNIDVDKRKPPEVGKVEEPVEGCDHDWNDPSRYEYVTQIVGGVNRYYKQCNDCGAKSILIKKREVELSMEADGKTINDVPLVK